jgi:molybdopterin-guanine dinucleotide biosynthesis protein A
MSAQRYQVVMLAGHSPDEPGMNKALTMVAGQPMISRVVRAWQASGRMRHLTIVGLQATELPTGIDWSQATLLANQASLIDNGVAALRSLPDPTAWAAVTSCDIPLLTAEIIVSYLDAAEAVEADLIYPIVEQEVMERVFPGAGRSYRQLKEGRFCGGDIMLLRPEGVLRAEAFFSRLSAGRKSGLRLAAAIGPLTLLRFVLGVLPLAAVEQRAGRLAGMRVRALITELAELAMDVDKPHQLAVVERALQARHEQSV